jgi:predicted Zn-dependent protease with MMP-like domain
MRFSIALRPGVNWACLSILAKMLGRSPQRPEYFDILWLMSGRHIRLSRGEFDNLVEKGIAAIPARFRSRMRNIVIVVEPYGPSSDLLGLYEGRPATERSTSSPGFEEPDRVRIFQRAHERMAHSRAQLERMVADTVWHEIGHFFGLSEAEIHAVEQRRERLRRLRAGYQR